MGTRGQATVPNDAYTIAWICVNFVEFYAAQVLLDETYSRPYTPDDDSPYTGGRMGEHNIVIGKSTEKGKSAAAIVATHMIRTFPNIRFALIVGIGGGATTAPAPPGHNSRPIEIFLGDVVVSAPSGTHGGIIQYDAGRRVLGEHQIESHLNTPPAVLVKATQTLRKDWHFGGAKEKMLESRDKGLQRWESMGAAFETYRRPSQDLDKLFHPDYRHQGPSDGVNPCAHCSPEYLIERRREDNIPLIHYGLIGSADTLVRDARFRDQMRDSDNVLCFEMETAGLKNEFPCLAIRGISDYSDSHKNDIWHPYAAMNAAAYAKEVLITLQPRSVFGSDIAQKCIGIAANLEYSQRNEILTHLSPLDFNTTQDELLKDCVSTSQWLTNKDVFAHWVEGTKWQLRCYGETGVGKTFLCAQIVDHLRKAFPTTSPPTNARPVIFIYLSDEKKPWADQTADNILGSLVKQLLQSRGDGHIPDELQQAYRGERARETALKEVFEDLLGQFERTYLIVDGLYQCTSDVLDIVKSYPLELIKRKFRLSLLTTSSGYREVLKLVNCDRCKRTDIEVYYNCDCNNKDFDLCPKCRHRGVSCPQHHDGKEHYDTVRIAIRGRNSDHDIVRFCRRRLDKESTIESRESDSRHHAQPHISSPVGRYLHKNPQVKRLVAEQIAKNADGNFSIAKAWLDDLIAMNEEPQSFDDLYDSIMCVPKKVLSDYFNEKIENFTHWKPENDRRLAFTAVSIAMAAFRPLNILALQHALSLDGSGFIRETSLSPRVDIVRAANGLLCIDRANASESFVRLFHSTVSVLSIGEHSLTVKPHLKMANLCLMYLEHADFESYSTRPLSYPFLSYALEHWGDHVREADDSDLDDRALRLLTKSDKVREIAQGAGALDSSPVSIWIDYRDDGDDEVDAVHLCAWYNLSSLISRLHRKSEYDINVRDHKNRTPLRYACVNSNLEAVRELLALGGTPKNDKARNAAIRDTIKGLPTSERFPDQEIRRIHILNKILQKADLNLSLDSPIDAQRSTILMYAIRQECYEFVAVLLGKYRDSIDVNQQDIHGRTALWYAVGPSHVSPHRSEEALRALKSIVRLLVAHDDDPNTNCKTAVTQATLYRNSGLVSIICPGL